MVSADRLSDQQDPIIPAPAHGVGPLYARASF
jgi:hypothetical protein